METDRDYTIKLGRDEALVLSDWLHRHLEKGVTTSPFEDQAVWPALWAVSGSLETQLVEIFSPLYGELVDAARQREVTRLNLEDEGSSEVSG